MEKTVTKIPLNALKRISILILIGFWAGEIAGIYFDIDKYLLKIIMLALLATFGISFAHILKTKEYRYLFMHIAKIYIPNFKS